MKRALTAAMAAFLLLCSSCSGQPANFNATYDVVATRHNQYFKLSADALLNDLNAKLSEYDLSLCITPKEDSDLSVWYSQNGEGWKIAVDLMGSFDASLASETQNWAEYIKQVELSLYSDGEEASKQNGQYIRAIINTFTPGSERKVEDALGIYGEPNAKAIITDGVYRVAIGNVEYTYKKGSGKYSSESFLVTPHDADLDAQSSKEPASAIRPE